MVLLTMAAGIIWVIWGVLKEGYYIPEISTQFFIMGLVSGIIGVIFKLNGMKLNDIASSFKQGAADLVGAALIVGMAQGIMLVLGGSDPAAPTVLNTILHGISEAFCRCIGNLCGSADVPIPGSFQFLCRIRLRPGRNYHADHGAIGRFARRNQTDCGFGLPAGRRSDQYHRSHFRMSHGRTGCGKNRLVAVD